VNLSNAPRGRFFALMLIAAGALLFLDNLGLVHIYDVQGYWPVWFVIWGLVVLDRRRTLLALIWSSALVAYGILLILGNLRIIHANADIIWPIFLIAFGLTMLVRPMPFNEWPEFFRFQAFASRYAAKRFSGNRLNEAVVFGSLNRRVESQDFEGGKLASVFGSIELDLSGASISSSDRQAWLKADAVFGGIEIRVPRTWRVVMKGAAVFGGCDDKTVPPRPEPGVQLETLMITGAAIFGGVEIRN
jgi:predicted membrane protein